MLRTQKFYYIRSGFVSSLISRGAHATFRNMMDNSPTRYPVMLLECTIAERSNGKKVGTLIEHSYRGVKNVVDQFAITDGISLSRFRDSCKAYAVSVCAESVLGGSVDVFRKAGRSGDFTNGGISSKNSTLFLAGVSSFYSSEMGANDFNVCVVPVNTGDDHIALMRLKDVLACKMPMFGGNFAFNMESSFRQFSDYPLPIHDRFEK